jgi:hypothetical protein
VHQPSAEEAVEEVSHRENVAGRDRITMWVASVETADPANGIATVRGEVWLGPVAPGDWFTAATTAAIAEPIHLQVAELATPAHAQEPGRVPRVVAVLEGEGVERVHAGAVLVGPSGAGQPRDPLGRFGV